MMTSYSSCLTLPCIDGTLTIIDFDPAVPRLTTCCGTVSATTEEVSTGKDMAGADSIFVRGVAALIAVAPISAPLIVVVSIIAVVVVAVGQGQYLCS